MLTKTYDFTAKEEQYRGLSDLDLLYALKDARACVRIWRGEWRRNPTPESAANDGYYSDDVSTIRKILAERGLKPQEIDAWLEAREV